MTQTRLFCRDFYLIFFSSRVPGRKLRAETFSAVTVCLRTCQPSTEWSLCCFYSHKGCCAVISASLHLPDNSVSKIGAPARQEALFSLPKNKPQDRKRDLGGFRVAAEHIWIVFLLRSLCCRLEKKKKAPENLRLWVFWSLLLFLSSTFSHSWLQEISSQRLIQSHELHVVLCATRQLRPTLGLWLY